MTSSSSKKWFYYDTDKILTSNSTDAIYAAVQPAGQAPSAEVVRGPPGQGEEEDHARAHHDDPVPEAEDVQLSRVEGLQDCLQKVGPGQSLGERGYLELMLVFTCRYASLYFCCAIEQNDNELLTLEIIHRYVELLDKYFGSVSSCDCVTNEAQCNTSFV